ncbi:Hypothetical protein FKW44_020201, partial [Caligus rogercresseyi]
DQSLCGNMDLISNVIRATILFGAFRRRRKISPHQKAVEFALLNMKSLIAKRLTNNSYIRIEDLTAVMIGTAARYSTLINKNSQFICDVMDMDRRFDKVYSFKFSRIPQIHLIDNKTTSTCSIE